MDQGTITTIPVSEFDRDTTSAILAARQGPVLLSEDGVPVYAFLTIEQYRRLKEKTAG